MANKSKAPDASLLIDVEGGGSINGASGKRMLEQVTSILNEIEKNAKIKVSIDPDSLKNIKSDVAKALKSAVSSVQNMPISFTLVPGEDSINKTVKEFKKKLSEQNITIGTNIKDSEKKKQTQKKESVDNTSSINTNNIKKDAETAKQGLKEVKEEVRNTTAEVDDLIQNMMTKLNRMSSGLSSEELKKYATVLLKIKDEEKQVFSTDSIAVFKKAIDLSPNAKSLLSIIDVFKSIKTEVTDVISLSEKLKTTLLETSITKMEYKFSDIDVLQEFLEKSKIPYQKDGYKFTEKEYNDWADSYKSNGSDRGNEIARILQWNKNRSKIFGSTLQSLIDYYDGILKTVVESDGTVSYKTGRKKAIDHVIRQKWSRYVGEADQTNKYNAQMITDGFNNMEVSAVNSSNVIESELERVNRLLDETTVKANNAANALNKIGGNTKYELVNVSQSNLPTVYDSENPGALYSREHILIDIQRRVKEAVENLINSMMNVPLALPQESYATQTQNLQNQMRQRIESIIGDATVDTFKSLNSSNSIPLDAYVAQLREQMRQRIVSLVDSTTVGMFKSLGSSNTIPLDLYNANVEATTARLREQMRQRIIALVDGATVNTFRSLDSGNTIPLDLYNANVEATTARLREQMRQRIIALVDNTTVDMFRALNSDNVIPLDLYNANVEATATRLKEQVRQRIIALVDGVTIDMFRSLNAGNALPLNMNEPNIIDVDPASIREVTNEVVVLEGEAEKAADVVGGIVPKGLNSRIEALTGKLEGLEGIDLFGKTASSEALKNTLNEIYNLREAIQSGDYSNVSGIENYDQAVSRLTQLLPKASEQISQTKKEMTRLQREADKTANSEEKVAEAVLKTNVLNKQLYQSALSYYQRYQAGIKSNISLNQQWLDLLRKINSGALSGDEARLRLVELQTATKEAKAEVQSLWGELKRIFTGRFGAMSATMFIGTFRSVLRGMYQNVLDIDKAMTELKKVTDLAEDQYESFMGTATDLAKRVGGSIADTINSTADFARLGFNIGQSTSLAEAAMVYKNVGDGIESISEASESIISTIKAFNSIDASDAMSIIDKFNEVGNNYAISSVGIGTALQKSAAALASANNTLDESIAIITAGNSVVQNPEIIGTAAKTISMYLRAAKTEAEEAGIETDGMVESVSKLRTEIKSLSGVDIMLNSKDYKSTYQILKEISEAWDNISDVSRANILEKLGGKRNANVVASIIENFDIAEQALETSLNSEGSALAENEKYLESIEGHLNRLKVAYEDLSQTVVESDMVKTGIDFLTNVAGGLNDVMNIFGALPTTIGAATAALSAFKDAGIIRRDSVKSLFVDVDGVSNKPTRTKNLFADNTHSEIERIMNGFNNLDRASLSFDDDLKDIIADANKFGGVALGNKLNEIAKAGEGATASTTHFYEALLGGKTKGRTNVLNIIDTFNTLDTSKQQEFATAVGVTNQNLGKYLSNLNGAQASGAKYVAQLAASKAATISLTIVTSALNAAISMGISLIATGLVQVISDAVNGEEKLAEKVKEATDAYKSQQKSLEDLQKEYENIIDSSKSEIDKMQDLYEWKRKVIDAYGDEADAIHQVNLERQTGLDYIDEEKYRQNVTYIEDKDVKENYDNIINKLSDLTSGNFKLEGLRSTKHNLTDEDIMNFFITEIGRLSNGNITAISSITGNMATASGVNVTLRYGNDYQDAIKNIQDIINTIHNIQTDPKNGRALKGTEQLILNYFTNLLSEYEKAVDDSKDAISEYNQALYDVAWHEFRKANKKDLTKISEEDLNEYLNNFSDYLRRNDLYSKYFNSVDFKNLINSKSEALKVSLFPESLIESNDIGYISSLKEKLNDLDDSVKTLLSNKDTIESTLKKVRQGLVLTEDEVQKLKEISPDLLGKFKETDGGWVISESDLVDTYDKQLKNVTEKINEHRIKIKDQIDDIKSQFVSVLDSVPSEVAEKIKNGEYSNNTYFAPSREDAQKLEDLNNQYSALNVLLSMIALDVNNVNEKFREYNNTIEYSAKLGSNLSTLNAATALSNSISLYSKSDDWERDFDKQARAMQSAYIENKELTEAYNRWYSNRNTTTAKALVEVYKKAYNDDLNNFNSYLMRKASDLEGYEDDKSVWKQFVEDNETAVAELADLYAIDLANVTTYAEAREKILEATSTKTKNFTNLDYLPTFAKEGINNSKNAFTEYFQSVFLSWFTQDPLASDTSVETGLAEKSYSQSLDKLQQANTGTIEAEKKFVKEWIALNDEFYATTDPEKYKSNLREIASYIAGFSKTISENLAVWARENDHNDNSYADRLVYLQVWEQSSQELYGTLELLEGKLRAIENVGGDTTATLKSILDVKKAIDEDSLSRASYEAETYKLKYESGYYQSFDEYKKDILSLGDTYKTTEDKSLLDGTFFDKYIDANAEFEGKLKEYTRANEKTSEAQTAFFKSVRDTLTDLRFRKDDHMDPSDYLEHYMKDYADPYVKWLKEQMDKGLKTPEDVASEIQKLYDNAKDKDQVDLGKDWLADALNIDSYEYDSKQLMKINDKTFKSEQEYVAGMKKLAYERYGDSTSRFYDLTKYESSMKSIIDYELAMLKKAFQEGKISAKEYAEYITQILDEKTGMLLGADYVADQTKDALEARGNREKTYWEQQKKLMTKYYDTEIEKLQEIKNEREKEAAIQKLQLNLIKARIELEKAKSQRNILQFKDGAFEYVADQDAVKSAEEEVANALDEIRANELDRQIELLEKQKDNASAFYDDIIEVIDAFMNHTTWIAESDSEYLKQARESQEGQETKEYQAGNIAPNQLTQDQLNTTGTSDKKKDKAVKAVDIAHENKKTDSEEFKKTWSDYITKPMEDLVREVKELTKVIGETSIGNLIFGSSGTGAQEIAASGMNNIVTNGNISNSNSVKTGDINVNVQGGTSQEMLDQFVNGLSNALTTVASKSFA